MKWLRWLPVYIALAAALTALCIHLVVHESEPQIGNAVTVTPSVDPSSATPAATDTADPEPSPSSSSPEGLQRTEKATPPPRKSGAEKVNPPPRRAGDDDNDGVPEPDDDDIDDRDDRDDD